MEYRYKQLEQDLSALSSAFSQLGGRLSDAAKDVTAGGVLPSEKLVEQILLARTAFDSIRTAVHTQAGSMLVSPLPKATELVSIQAIAALLKAAANAEEIKSSFEGERERASAILSRVLAITHREMADFKPLQDCQAKVTELRTAISVAAWPKRHPESESVLAMKHPCTALLSFVENLETLEDEKWMALEPLITEAYGKPLFVAASRGKLLAQQSAKPPVAAKPVPAPEKKSVPEKPAVATPAPVEKKESPAAAEKSHPAPIPPAPTQVTPAAPPAAVPVAPVTVAPAPPAAAPVTATVTPQRSPAPVPAPAEHPAAVSSAPPITQPLGPVTVNSLSALANATEPTAATKPAPTPAPDSAEKTRREPRLAAPIPQQARTEGTSHEHQVSEDESSALAGDGSQRPQRWGFWRGNR